MTPPERTDLSVVVLAYRTGRGLIRFVDSLSRSLSQAAGNPGSWEIILVANYWPGQGDETPAVAEQLARRDPRVRSLAQPKQGAMGWDMRSGLEAARGDYLAVIDGDGQVPAEDVVRVYQWVRAQQADLGKTFRVDRRDGPWRRLISSVFNTLFSLLFPHIRSRDINAKPKVLRRSAYERMDLRDDDWFIDAEMMIQAGRLGLSLAELPTTFSRLEERASFVRPKAILEFLGKLLAARWRG